MQPGFGLKGHFSGPRQVRSHELSPRKSSELLAGFATWIRFLVLIAPLMLTGCSGCLKETKDKLTREELEKKAREQESALEMSALVSLPSDEDAKLLTVKPGHWTETQQQFKSNREDLQVVAVNGVNRGNGKTMIPGTDFVNDFTRRTSLPKGQTKTVDLQCFVPFSARQTDDLQTTSTRLTFTTELLSWPLMTPILQSPSLKPAMELKQHEFQLIALGDRALSYEYLTILDAVYWQGDGLMTDERTRSYYVTLSKPKDGKYAIPRSLLTMTAIAAIVWDDVSPDNLSADQKNAILDWVHWGGQLVVSGPSSWARLQDSFLSDYLPVREVSNKELTSESFAELSQTWLAPDLNKLNKPEPIKIVGKPVAGLQMELSTRGTYLPGTGGLVAESQVGRGRIIFTGFPMTEPRIFRWPYFSSFFSTGLLRRHPRMIRRSTEERTMAQYWATPFQTRHHDARLHSNVRILSRDLALKTNDTKNRLNNAIPDDADIVGGSTFKDVPSNEINTPAAERIRSQDVDAAVPNSVLESAQWGGSAAAWNDYSGSSFATLKALRAAAGIELPSKRTILYLLAGYLVCLVPLNWAFFRVIGRLEYAWVAAPIMAVIGVGVVTRVARLDIGFARRTTEISILELQGDYSRGHLTQYLALYTSLSTNYSAEFPENDSVALPLGDLSRESRRAKAEVRNLKTNYGRSDGVTLEPLTVYSNSTEMIHAEQIIPLKGGLRLGNRSEDGTGPEALKNESELDLLSVLLLRRTEDDQVQTAWVGDLAADQAASINFSEATQASLSSNWEENPITQSMKPGSGLGESSETDALWVGGVLKELVLKTPLMPGQTRLFGYTNDRTSQLTLSPGEDQFDGRCLVVAHLTPTKLGGIVPDLNIRSRGKVSVPDEEQLDEAVKGMLQTDPSKDTPADQAAEEKSTQAPGTAEATDFDV